MYVNPHFLVHPTLPSPLGIHKFVLYTHVSISALQISSSVLVAQTVKNLPAMLKTWVQSPGWEDALEEDMTTHSSIPAWRILMDRGAWWVTVHGVAELDMTEQAQGSYAVRGGAAHTGHLVSP